jgi:hypothetical protein
MPTIVFMAVVPFHDQAVAHWHTEVERARQDLLASLDDLRKKADGFLKVSALATTFFAVLDADGPADGSDPNPFSAPESGNGNRSGNGSQPPRLTRLLDGNLDTGPHGPTENGRARYPDNDEPGAVPLPGAQPGVSGPPAPAPFPAITSTNRVFATVGRPMSFTVTTMGQPVPSIIWKGPRPKSIAFVDNNDGTATLWGTPDATGVCDASIKSTFGQGRSRYIVTQAFTVTVGC